MTLRGDPEHRTPCAEVGAPDLWFAKERSKRQFAVSVCRSCPAQDRCLAEALRLHPIRGIWGGTTLADRERLLLLLAADGRAPKQEASRRAAGAADSR